MGPKAEYIRMARGLVESFSELKHDDVYALAYWLQAWYETAARKAEGGDGE